MGLTQPLGIRMMLPREGKHTDPCPARGPTSGKGTHNTEPGL